MSFNTILKSLVEKVPGAQGAILLDWEGEAVDQYANISDYDIKFIGAHMGIILHKVRKSLSEELNDQDIRGISIEMEKKRFSVCPVDNDYFAVIVMSSESVFGVARHELEGAVRSIREEF